MGGEHPLLSGWTDDDSAAARREGWDLFVDVGGHNCRAELQLHGIYAEDDETIAPFSENDKAAWRHVMAKVLSGNPLHVRALDVLRTNAPAEYDRVVRSV